MKQKIENLLIGIIAIEVILIIFFYWLAFGYNNHWENIMTLLNFTF